MGRRLPKRALLVVTSCVFPVLTLPQVVRAIAEFAELANPSPAGKLSAPLARDSGRVLTPLALNTTPTGTYGPPPTGFTPLFAQKLMRSSSVRRHTV